MFAADDSAVSASAPAEWFNDNPAWVEETEEDHALLVYQGAEGAPQLRCGREVHDNIVRLTYRLPAGGDPDAVLMMQARYPVPLGGEPGEWHELVVRVRGSRWDEANNKIGNAMILDAHRDGERILFNEIFPEEDPRSEYSWENGQGPTTLIASAPGFAIRYFDLRRADFEAVALPEESGQPSNIEGLVDFVALGREQFGSIGCAECHAVEADSTAVKTGPNLWSLFRVYPQQHEIADPEGHRFLATVDRTYLHNSIRSPQNELAIAAVDGIVPAGQPYLPVMPPYTEEVVSDQQIEAIGAYLLTLNRAPEQGPVERWLEPTGPENYDPLADRFNLLVDDTVRVQRGPMAGVSGRSLHVGQPNGLHYTFDPRVLGITKVWQGGFLNMSGEWRNRGGGGLKPGYESRLIGLGEAGVLFAPLHADGTAVDFGFKEAPYDDEATRVASLNSDIDPLDRLAQENAAFLGYERNSREPLAVPTFRYRVGANTLAVTARLAASGEIELVVEGGRESAQAFAVNAETLSDITVNSGSYADGTWTIPADSGVAVLTARMQVVANPWRPEPSDFDYNVQPLEIEPGAANLPAGYTVENYLAPRDSYGRALLFEALGIDLLPGGGLVVASRTAGIWRLVDGKWHRFAEGLFDSLGVLTESDDGSVVVAGHKSGLSRISDINGDGVADRYEVLSDHFSYHGNYHSYLHGPVRAYPDGDYFITLNLAHNQSGGYYNAGGKYMGGAGGYRGWAARVPRDGGFEPWASGLRSPAGVGFAPDNRLWYADNQGEFMGTSKLFVVEQDRFYGHPTGLVDLPGMTPESPEIQWDAVKHTVEKAVVLFPQTRLANSPGNPTWDTTGGLFGPFAGQLFIGDQTQSVLMRVDTELVGGVEQGAAYRFGTKFDSGIMRPVFLPDNSLLLGQTGRGWQAAGGKIAALQRIVWDGETFAPAIQSMQATDRGFAVRFTTPLADAITPAEVAAALEVESWTYRDAPDYGSPEMGERAEGVSRVVIDPQRDVVYLTLQTTLQPQVHEKQTARVYHLTFDGEALWGEVGANEPGLEAFYTLYRFAPSTEAVTHFDATGAGWQDLIAADLSNTETQAGVWSINDGVLTASEDRMLWTKSDYADFDLDLEFKNGKGANSGVIFHTSNVGNWVANSVELQIADDYDPHWANSEATWQCGALFGHLPAARKAVNPPGEWNRLSLSVRGSSVVAVLNGHRIIDADLNLWTSPSFNPDGSEIPPWMDTPFADLPRHGKIGLQGKHGGAPIWFRHARIREVTE